MLNPWAWRRSSKHQRLLQAIKDQPGNLDRVHAYVAELGVHNPRAVLEYVDKEVPAPNEAVIAEYLKALTKTNALSQYTAQGPLQEGADHRSLAQLLQDLSKKLQGEQTEAFDVGKTICRPLHVAIQDQSRAPKKHRVKRAATFLLYLVLAPLVVAALSSLGGAALSFGVLKGGSLTWATLSDPAELNKTTEGLADAWSHAAEAFSDSMNQTLSKMGFGSIEELWAESLGRGSDNQPYIFDQAVQRTDRSPWAFDEIKGCDEAKHELQEMVELMKFPEQLSGVKAHPPKGVLLVGPPGTGKTSMAKAIAAEAGFPFLYRAGSEFVNEFMGSGAKRVRALFEAARKAAPCIIFIDELDSVGSRSTYGGWGVGHDTVNQLLAEMDGFKPTAGVLVLAATNFKNPDSKSSAAQVRHAVQESLDKALTRPGRFDRIVQLTLPDMQGRLEILQHYMKEKPQEVKLDLISIARLTTGWSGADLSNLVNEAALAAVSKGITHLTTDLLTKAMEKVIMGLPRRSGFMTSEAKNQTAYHEAGHVIVGMYTENGNVVHKATIVPHGHSQGMVVQRPDEDWLHHSKQHLQASLDFAVAGRAATELAFEAGGVTAGATDDFKQATSLARAMVTQYGMSDNLGLMYLDGAKCPPGGDCEPLSSETRRAIESEVQSILKNASCRAKALLVHKQTELDTLAQALVTYETLTGPDMQAVLNGTFERSLVPSARLSLGLSKAREPYEMDKPCQGNVVMVDTPAQEKVIGCGDGDGDEHDVCVSDRSPE